MPRRGEFFAEEGGAEVRLVSFADVPETACDAYTRSRSFTAQTLEAELNAEGACRRFAPTNLAGTVFQLDVSGDTLFRDGVDGWQPIGETGPEGSELWMAWACEAT